MQVENMLASVVSRVCVRWKKICQKWLINNELKMLGSGLFEGTASQGKYRACNESIIAPR